MAVRLSATHAGRLSTPQEDSWYSFPLEAESTPMAIVRLEGLGELKNPMISSKFEPATFRLVLRYRVPQQYSDIINNKVSVVVDINKKKT
jgi:hypothetical protein